MTIRKLAFLGALAAGILSGAICLAAETPPYLSAPGETGSNGEIAVIDAKEIIKEAETLQRKANLVKGSAEKKYVEARRLQEQAGTYRAQASAATLAVQQRAAANQDTSEMLGSLFGMLGSVGPVPTPGQSGTMGLLMSANQKLDARTAAEEQTVAGQGEMQAEKTAGPLEMRAQTLEEDGNRLMAAFNRLQSLANAKFLLGASEELRQAVLGDREYLAGVRKKLLL